MNKYVKHAIQKIKMWVNWEFKTGQKIVAILWPINKEYYYWVWKQPIFPSKKHFEKLQTENSSKKFKVHIHKKQVSKLLIQIFTENSWL